MIVTLAPEPLQVTILTFQTASQSLERNKTVVSDLLARDNYQLLIEKGSTLELGYTLISSSDDDAS